MTACPDDDALFRHLDVALLVEEAARLDAHVAECARCTARRGALRRLVADLKAPVGPAIDVQAHARSVMARLEQAPGAGGRSRLPWVWAATNAVAACAVAVVLLVRPKVEHAVFQARGEASEATMARDVLVRPCTAKGSLVPLARGAVVDPDVPWTATFRNLGASPAFLLLFAVDSRHVVHWIAPRYARAGEDPAATPLPPSSKQEALGTTAVFDDVSPGMLRVVTVLSPSPTHVSNVEALEGVAWDEALLRRHLPDGADVRETVVEVRGGRQ